MKVQHPVFADVIVEVDNPADWAAAGWRVPDEPAVKPKPKPRPQRSKYPLI